MFGVAQAKKNVFERVAERIDAWCDRICKYLLTAIRRAGIACISWLVVAEMLRRAAGEFRAGRLVLGIVEVEHFVALHLESIQIVIFLVWVLVSLWWVHVWAIEEMDIIMLEPANYSEPKLLDTTASHIVHVDETNRFAEITVAGGTVKIHLPSMNALITQIIARKPIKALGPRPEMAFPDSIPQELPQVPDYQFTLCYRDAGNMMCEIGQGFRILTKAEDFSDCTWCVTAAHVVLALREHAEPVFLCHGDYAMQLDPKSIFQMLTTTLWRDAVLFPMKKSSAARLHLKAAKVCSRGIETGRRVGIQYRLRGKNYISYGPCVPYHSRGSFTHTVTTSPGASGAAVVNSEGVIVGLHCGANPARDVNVALCMRTFLNIALAMARTEQGEPIPRGMVTAAQILMSMDKKQKLQPESDLPIDDLTKYELAEEKWERDFAKAEEAADAIYHKGELYAPDEERDRSVLMKVEPEEDEDEGAPDRIMNRFLGMGFRKTNASIPWADLDEMTDNEYQATLGGAEGCTTSKDLSNPAEVLKEKRPSPATGLKQKLDGISETSMSKQVSQSTLPKPARISRSVAAPINQETTQLSSQGRNVLPAVRENQSEQPSSSRKPKNSRKSSPSQVDSRSGSGPARTSQPSEPVSQPISRRARQRLRRQEQENQSLPAPSTALSASTQTLQ